MDLDLFSKLTEVSGVPGYEDRVREIVRRELDPVVDEVWSDSMGNVVGTKNPGGDYEVAIAAHMDEIGFMVRHIDDDGFLELDALGGWDPRVLRAQRVTVHADSGDITGILGSNPPHGGVDEEDTPEVSDLKVDLGRDEDEVEDLVAVGDLVTMEQTTERIGDVVTGKALDDRSSVYAMLQAAKRADPSVTVHYAATVQEEVGLRGARALGTDLNPDLAIALDVTVAQDVPGFEAGERVTELGEGAAIKLKDSSVITNPKVHRRIREIAEAEDIDHQLEVLPAGGTDTAGFQNTSGATPVGALSIPTRYLHTVTETAHVEDIDAVVDLLTAVIESEDGTHDYTL
ncbi:MAG: M42 family metallopeptidase [Halobacteriaceae archaeon]